MKKYFSDHSPEVQQHILSLAMENVEISEQIPLRRVSPLWNGVVRRSCYLDVTALVLHLKAKEEKCIYWAFESRAYYDANVGGHFDALVADEIKPNQIQEFTIQNDHWNEATIAGIGKLFRHIKYLTIYDETNYPILVEKYCTLLPMLPKVESFSLVISNSVNSEFVTRLFKVINTHLAPLHVLHLYFSLDFFIPKNDEEKKLKAEKEKEEYPRLAIKDIDTTLRWLKSFSFVCKTKNLNILLRNFGKNISNVPKCNFKPLQILSIGMQDSEQFKVDQIAPMFRYNREMASLKRLQLVKIDATNLNFVQAILVHFKQLESLQLWYSKYQFAVGVPLTVELLTSISRLAHLRELKLYGFQINIFKTVDEPAWQVRRLTIVRRNLFIDFYQEHIKLYPQNIEENENEENEEDEEDEEDEEFDENGESDYDEEENDDENQEDENDEEEEEHQRVEENPLEINLKIFLGHLVIQFPVIEELTIQANLYSIGGFQNPFPEWLNDRMPHLKEIHMINMD